QRLVNWLCEQFGYDDQADGIFTSGGTQSNFMGLLLARDHYCQARLGWSVQQRGLPPEAQRFRILCSEVSHFTIGQAASLLGLGEQAVVTVPTDEHFRMDPKALARILDELQAQDLLPIALVATVGTTDFGSIDPLPELAQAARTHDLWLHVDAAYGGALILSDRNQSLLAGIEAADSITVDFHKLFYQPISCGAFLLKVRSHFELIKRHAAYLNPEENESDGIPDLVTKSVQTTRRFDALKLWVSLQHLGRQGFAAMIDATINLAQQTAHQIAADPALELAHQPVINAVVFRYRPSATLSDQANLINRHIRQALLHRGQAVLAQTQVAGRTHLKLTLLNPRTTLAHVSDILSAVKQLGNDLEKEYGTHAD
ncbi:MAG TPA: aspartate aminotransferase family protein, partial [Trichocoleus sp.]